MTATSDDPTSVGTLSVAAIGVPMALALTMARPRCASCGEVVDTSITAVVGETGRAEIRQVEVDCTTRTCERMVESTDFAAPVSSIDAAIVARLRPVVFGGWS